MLEFRLDGLQLAGKLIELVQTGSSGGSPAGCVRETKPLVIAVRPLAALGARRGPPTSVEVSWARMPRPLTDLRRMVRLEIGEKRHAVTAPWPRCCAST